MTVDFLCKMFRPDIICRIYRDKTYKIESFYRADVLASGAAMHSKETVKDWRLSQIGFDILIKGEEK